MQDIAKEFQLKRGIPKAIPFGIYIPCKVKTKLSRFTEENGSVVIYAVMQSGDE